MPVGSEAAIGCALVVFMDCPKAFLMSDEYAEYFRLAHNCIMAVNASLVGVGADRSS